MFNKMLDLQKKLKKEVVTLRQDLKEYPTEDLFVSKNGKYTKYYISNGSNPIYIRKKDTSYAQLLAVKKYKTYLLEEKTKDLIQLSRMLCLRKKYADKAAKMLDEDSNYYQLLQNYYKNSSQQISDWQNEEYEINRNYEENLIHKTLAGHYVRSKSEVMIANSLYMKRIPYRYECAFTMEEITLYPDFTIMHPKDKSIFYWEHFGIMDNEDYRNSAFRKLKIYGDSNVLPSINLIATFETKTHPIDSTEIEEKIQKYFL